MLRLADFNDPVVCQKETMLGIVKELTHLDDDAEVITPDDTNLSVLRCLLFSLNLCVPVWNAERYGYKGREVIDRIQGIITRTRCRLPHQATAKTAALALLETHCSTIREQFVDPAALKTA